MPPFKAHEPGTLLLKRYRVEKLIRAGGMGATYIGTDLETSRTIAIKELLNTFKTTQEKETGIGNFLAEISVLKTLKHPQIPQIFDHFVEKDNFFFILEYIDGKDFSRRLEETGRTGLPEIEVIRTGIRVCQVLSYLHNHSPSPIIHRDIKSSNIMERKVDGRIMLIDFGISKAANPGEGMMIGTLGYSSPEQHLNQFDARSDIYSLSATLHELSTGIRPSCETFEFPIPSEVRPEISLELSNIIIRGLYYYPDERFQTAQAYEEALQSLLMAPLEKTANNSFEISCEKFLIYLIPLLREIKKEYINEFEGDLPNSLDYAKLTLGIQIPFSLIIKTHVEKEIISFYLREGMLSEVFLGEISPHMHESWGKTKDILKQFLKKYETSGRN